MNTYLYQGVVEELELLGQELILLLRTFRAVQRLGDIPGNLADRDDIPNRAEGYASHEESQSAFLIMRVPGRPSVDDVAAQPLAAILHVDEATTGIAGITILHNDAF